MKFETYKNWRITTERDLPSCCGLTHYTDIVKLDLSTPVNKDNYHLLIDEANNIIYMWFSQLKKEITKSMKMLQQN